MLSPNDAQVKRSRTCEALVGLTEAAAQGPALHRIGNWHSRSVRPLCDIGQNCVAPPAKKPRAAPSESSVVVVESDEEGDSRQPPAKPSSSPEDVFEKRKRLYDAKYKQVLRISGSKVAAVAGLNSFVDVGELFLEHLYQDLMELYIYDSSILGLEVELISDDELRKQLMTKSGSAADLESALQIADAAQDVESVKTALAGVEDALKIVSRDEKLDSEEFTQLRDMMHRKVCCGFGDKHEDAGLRAYEARVGSRVYEEQRSLCLRMPKGGASVALANAFPATGSFQPAEGKVSSSKAGTAPDANGQVVPWADFVADVQAKVACLKKLNGPISIAFASSLTSAERKYVHRTAEGEGLFSQSLGDGEDRYLKLYRDMSAAATDRQELNEAERRSDENTHFKLIGKIDGLIDLSESTGCTSKMKTLVVEMKHRTRRIANPPDTKEVVQLCTYCRVLGCEEGDLVQSLRERNAVETSPTPLKMKAASSTMHVARLDFRKGSMHRDGWDKHVLPAMYAFADGIYAARHDDSLRYRLLASDASQRKALVESLCPHLER